jgi:hypothetical protein
MSDQYVIMNPIFTSKYGKPAWINQDITRFPSPNFDRAHRFDTYQEARAKRRSQHDFILTIEEAQEMIKLFKVGGRSLMGYSHGSISSKDLQGR